MNRKLLVAVAVAAVAASSSSFAAVEKHGFYVGAQGGVSRADDGSFLKDLTEKAPAYEWKQGGFGWRALAGYQFNRTFSIEGGYTRFADNTYRADFLVAGYDITHKTSAWDLVGKAALPIADSNFDVYAKAGAAYQKTEYTANTGISTRAKLDSKSKVRPVAGIGAAYNFDNGLALDISWTRIFGNGKTDINGIGQPDSDLVALGVTYTFQQWA